MKVIRHSITNLLFGILSVCGDGNPAYAAKMKSVKLWVFHGSDDRTVPLNRLRDILIFRRFSGASIA